MRRARVRHVLIAGPDADPDAQGDGTHCGEELRDDPEAAGEHRLADGAALGGIDASGRHLFVVPARRAVPGTGAVTVLVATAFPRSAISPGRPVATGLAVRLATGQV